MIIRRVKWSIQRQISNSAVTGGSGYLPEYLQRTTPELYELSCEQKNNLIHGKRVRTHQTEHKYEPK